MYLSVLDSELDIDVLFCSIAVVTQDQTWTKADNLRYFPFILKIHFPYHQKWEVLHASSSHFFSPLNYCTKLKKLFFEIQ